MKTKNYVLKNKIINYRKKYKKKLYFVVSDYVNNQLKY